KVLLGPLLQLVEFIVTGQHQGHAVGGVMFGIKIQQFVTDIAAGTIGQGIQVAGGERGKGVLRVHGLLFGGKNPAEIVFQLGTVFRMHGIFFALDIGGVEGGGNKEGREAVERTGQGVVVQLEEIGGLAVGGKGVMAAAMTADVGLVLTGFRIGFGA